MRKGDPVGMKVVHQASGEFEAELVCLLLRAESLPAAVLDANLSHWCWHARLGFNRGGIRVVVPACCLEQAREILADARRAGSESPYMQIDEADDLRGDAAWMAGATIAIALLLPLLSPWLFLRGLRQIIQAVRLPGSPLSGWNKLHFWTAIVALVPVVCTVALVLFYSAMWFTDLVPW